MGDKAAPETKEQVGESSQGASLEEQFSSLAVHQNHLGSISNILVPDEETGIGAPGNIL